MINKLSIIITALLIIGCEKSADQLMKRGDQFLEDGKYEQAINQYSKIVEKYSRNPLAESAHYQIVNVLLDYKNDYMAGYSELEKIVELYPGSPRAKVAKDDLDNFPSWLFLKSDFLRNNNNPEDALKALNTIIDIFSEEGDLAQAHYAIADIHLVSYRNETEAARLFKQVSKDYTDSPQGPHAQFMAGYVYANMLGNLENGRQEYELFMKMYPDHDLASSVQFELEHLGQDIEDIVTLKKVNE
jgi:outer membrane protein assembly factor BamD (BamD/ComL family)